MSGRGSSDSERPSATPGVSGSVELEPSHDGATDGPNPRAPSEPSERRSSERIDVLWSVDCETEDTFLYAAITNISAMGIFVCTTEPLAVGTIVTLRFAPPHHDEAFALGGVVQWVNRVRPREDNPNPGMGIRFLSLSPDDRERIVEAIRTIAYLREEPRDPN